MADATLGFLVDIVAQLGKVDTTQATKDAASELQNAFAKQTAPITVDPKINIKGKFNLDQLRKNLQEALSAVPALVKNKEGADELTKSFRALLSAVSELQNAGKKTATLKQLGGSLEADLRKPLESSKNIVRLQKQFLQDVNRQLQETNKALRPGSKVSEVELANLEKKRTSLKDIADRTKLSIKDQQLANEALASSIKQRTAAIRTVLSDYTASTAAAQKALLEEQKASNENLRSRKANKRFLDQQDKEENKGRVTNRANAERAAYAAEKRRLEDVARGEAKAQQDSSNKTFRARLANARFTAPVAGVPQAQERAGALYNPLARGAVAGSTDIIRLRDTQKYLREVLAAQDKLTRYEQKRSAFGINSEAAQKSVAAARDLAAQLTEVEKRIKAVRDAEAEKLREERRSQRTQRAVVGPEVLKAGKEALARTGGRALDLTPEERLPVKAYADARMADISTKLKSGGLNAADIAKLSKEYNNLRSVVAMVNREMAGNVGIMHDAAIAMRQFFRYAILYGSGYRIIAGFLSMGRAILDLDEKLKGIQAVAQATSKDMTDVGVAITRVAQSTKFSTSEIADAAQILAQAGVEISDLPKVLEATAKFAQATATSLETSADLMASVRSTFSEFNGREGVAADLLTNAVNQSKLTGEQLKVITSLQLQTAKAYGLNLRQSLAIDSVLSNTGFKASTIATGSRQTLKDILSPNDKLLEALLPFYKKAGLEMGKEQIRAQFLEFQVRKDKFPNPLIAALEEYKKLGIDKPENRNKVTRFMDAQGANAFNALIDMIDKLVEQEALISRSGTAAQGAATQMEAVNNAFRRMQSAAVSMANSIFKDGLPALAQLGNKLADLFGLIEKGAVEAKAQGKSTTSALGAGGSAAILAGMLTKGGAFAKGAAGGVAGLLTTGGSLALQSMGGVASQVASVLDPLLGILATFLGLKSVFGKGKAAGAVAEGATEAVVAVEAVATGVKKLGLLQTAGKALAALPVGKVVSIVLLLASGIEALLGLVPEKLRSRLEGLREKQAKQSAEQASAEAAYAPFALNSSEGQGKEASDFLRKTRSAKPGDNLLPEAAALRKLARDQIQGAYDKQGQGTDAENRFNGAIVDASRFLSDPRYSDDKYLASIEGAKDFAVSYANYVEAIHKSAPQEDAAKIKELTKTIDAAKTQEDIDAITKDLPRLMADLRNSAEKGVVEDVQRVIRSLEKVTGMSEQDVKKATLLSGQKNVTGVKGAGPEVTRALEEARALVGPAQSTRARLDEEAKARATARAAEKSGDIAPEESPDEKQARTNAKVSAAQAALALNKRQIDLAKINGDYKEIQRLLSEQVQLLQEENKAIAEQQNAGTGRHDYSEAEVKKEFDLRAAENKAQVEAERRKATSEQLGKSKDAVEVQLQLNKTKLEVAENAKNYAEVNRLVKEQAGIQEAMNRLTRDSEIASGKNKELANAEYELRRQQNETNSKKLQQEKGTLRAQENVQKQITKYEKQLQGLNDSLTAAEQRKQNTADKLAGVQSDARGDAAAFKDAKAQVFGIEQTPKDKIEELMKQAREMERGKDYTGLRDISNKIRDQVTASASDIGQFDSGSLLNQAEKLNKTANDKLVGKAKGQDTVAGNRLENARATYEETVAKLEELKKKSEELSRIPISFDQEGVDAAANQILAGVQAKFDANPVQVRVQGPDGVAAPEGMQDPTAPPNYLKPGEVVTNPDLSYGASNAALGNRTQDDFYAAAATAAQFQGPDTRAFPRDAYVTSAGSSQATGTPVNLHLGGGTVGLNSDDPKIEERLKRLLSRQALKESGRL